MWDWVGGCTISFTYEVFTWVNHDTGRYFLEQKGLHKGGPLSPMLFNIVADMLAIFFERAKFDG
jgi:hypothetical protein